MNQKQAHINTVSIPIERLIPHPKNPNTHNDRQIKKLRHLIKVHGYSKGSVVFQTSTHYLLAGHGVIEALKQEGYTHVDAVELDVDDSKAEAFMIADNKIADDSVIDSISLQNLINELSEMNIPSLDFGFDSQDLEDLASQILADSGGYQAEPQDDEIPETVEPITQVGDLWTLGKHRVLCGDSTKAEDVAKLMDGEKSELLFTSPPYSDMREYNGEIDLSINNLINFISTFEPYANYQVVNLGIQRKDNEIFPYWNAYIDKAKDVGYKLLSWNVWDKNSGGSVGNMTAMFPIEHEWLFVFGKNRKGLTPTVPNITAGEKTSWRNRKKDGSLGTTKSSVKRDFREIGTVFRERQVNDNGLHPATFPIALPFRYIEAMTNESDIVCDCFGGSGTSLIACQQLNRIAYLQEIDQHYCDVIVKRYIDFVGATAGVFVERNGEKIEYEELVDNTT